MAYREFKDLLTGTASHKILCDKALDIMDIQSQISWISKGSWFRSQLLFVTLEKSKHVKPRMNERITKTTD